jgi:hypothetical protein
MHETPPTTRLAAVAATQASASSIKISVGDGRATQAPAKPHPRRGNVEKAPNQACGSLSLLVSSRKRPDGARPNARSLTHVVGLR